MTKRDELIVPDIDEGLDAVEMARIWITPGEGVSYVSLNYGIFEDQELRVWGSLAADLIGHAVRAHLLGGASMTTDEALAVVESALRERLAYNPTMSGRFPRRAVS